VTTLQLLEKRWEAGKYMCVGFDPNPERLPKHLQCPSKPEGLAGCWKAAQAYLTFCQEIAIEVGNEVAAFKPNYSFFEQLGWQGIRALEKLIAFLKKQCPEVPVILDRKFGDIGTSNEGPVNFAFRICGADAITMHCYLGEESVRKPALDAFPDKLFFVLCRTSNPGAKEFQDIQRIPSEDDTSTKLLYQTVADNVAGVWNKVGNCGLVVGATYPDELLNVRKIVGRYVPLLIPGVGKSQGGGLEATLRNGLSQERGIIVNLSREVLYASDGTDYAEAARLVVDSYNNQVQSFLVKESQS